MNMQSPLASLEVVRGCFDKSAALAELPTAGSLHSGAARLVPSSLWRDGVPWKDGDSAGEVK